MDLYELKKEQVKFAPRVVLRDTFTKLRTVGGAACVPVGEKILACVTVCEYPSFELLEKKTYLLHNPLPHRQGYEAYREMPAIIEAYNQLEQEPDLLFVNGAGILHPRKFGIASHIGLALNLPTIGVDAKLVLGTVEQGKVVLHGEILGFEIRTRQHANPVYVSPGHQISLGSVLRTIPSTIQHPHKIPEPLHLANKIARKKAKKMREDK